ncbi:sugar ABC transporter ATP-binding protein [Brevibacillus humidisoli]|uniref:sugar ABC transporter ATP-binding protein n=1 Tax=Brevibacillus humidisoli TaxID=2895522 RepID=UPI001E2AECF9|nr:sugar ABC transporter ATP-binding protein [Brevibacillus humidisoli]UFJ39469.1 sugar ABC transporter ATP-binding protein [Brevibacillus humidisoli]
MKSSLLEMRQVSKWYGDAAALQGVDFAVRGGEVHALLGANGAGKSTLMKILSGAQTASAGAVILDGEPLTLGTPRAAKQAGIHLVQQEVDTGLIPSLNTAENILLDRQVSRSGLFVSPWRLVGEAQRIVDECGFSLPLTTQVEQLTLAEKQFVLIARAVAQDVRFVIFDEPTAPLSLREAEALFALIGRLKQRGIGVVYISHRLSEVFRIADRITVLRDGQNVLQRTVGDTDMDEVVAAMLGKRFAEEFPKEPTERGDLLLEVSGLRAGHKVKRFDLRLHAGEVVAVVGLVGAGKSETARLLFGADRMEDGRVWLSGRVISCRTPMEAIWHGIVLVPEERRQHGVLVEETVKDNLTLANLAAYCTAGVVQRGTETSRAASMVERLGIKAAGLDQLVGRLSGGNQQKVAVGKWLLRDAQVYMFDEPTKGVDIGAKSDIFRLINQLAAEQKGIVYFSSEIDEAMGIADRLLVMENGRIVKEWERSEWISGAVTPETVMLYASGGEADGSES